MTTSCNGTQEFLRDIAASISKRRLGYTPPDAHFNYSYRGVSLLRDDTDSILASNNAIDVSDKRAVDDLLSNLMMVDVDNGNGHLSIRDFEDVNNLSLLVDAIIDHQNPGFYSKQLDALKMIRYVIIVECFLDNNKTSGHLTKTSKECRDAAESISLYDTSLDKNHLLDRMTDIIRNINSSSTRDQLFKNIRSLHDVDLMGPKGSFVDDILSSLLKTVLDRRYSNGTINDYQRFFGHTSVSDSTRDEVSVTMRLLYASACHIGTTAPQSMKQFNGLAKSTVDYDISTYSTNDEPQTTDLLRLIMVNCITKADYWYLYSHDHQSDMLGVPPTIGDEHLGCILYTVPFTRRLLMGLHYIDQKMVNLYESVVKWSNDNDYDISNLDNYRLFYMLRYGTHIGRRSMFNLESIVSAMLSYYDEDEVNYERSLLNETSDVKYDDNVHNSIVLTLPETIAVLTLRFMDLILYHISDKDDAHVGIDEMQCVLSSPLLLNLVRHSMFLSKGGLMFDKQEFEQDGICVVSDHAYLQKVTDFVSGIASGSRFYSSVSKSFGSKVCMPVSVYMGLCNVAVVFNAHGSVPRHLSHFINNNNASAGDVNKVTTDHSYFDDLLDISRAVVNYQTKETPCKAYVIDRLYYIFSKWYNTMDGDIDRLITTGGTINMVNQTRVFTFAQLIVALVIQCLLSSDMADSQKIRISNIMFDVMIKTTYHMLYNIPINKRYFVIDNGGTDHGLSYLIYLDEIQLQTIDNAVSNVVVDKSKNHPYYYDMIENRLVATVYLVLDAILECTGEVANHVSIMTKRWLTLVLDRTKDDSDHYGAIVSHFINDVPFMTPSCTLGPMVMDMIDYLAETGGANQLLVDNLRHDNGQEGSIYVNHNFTVTGASDPTVKITTKVKRKIELFHNSDMLNPNTYIDAPKQPQRGVMLAPFRKMTICDGYACSSFSINDDGTTSRIMPPPKGDSEQLIDDSGTRTIVDFTDTEPFEEREHDLQSSKESIDTEDNDSFADDGSSSQISDDVGYDQVDYASDSTNSFDTEEENHSSTMSNEDLHSDPYSLTGSESFSDTDLDDLLDSVDDLTNDPDLADIQSIDISELDDINKGELSELDAIIDENYIGSTTKQMAKTTVGNNSGTTVTSEDFSEFVTGESNSTDSRPPAASMPIAISRPTFIEEEEEGPFDFGSSALLDQFNSDKNMLSELIQRTDIPTSTFNMFKVTVVK